MKYRYVLQEPLAAQLTEEERRQLSKGYQQALLLAMEISGRMDAQRTEEVCAPAKGGQS